MEKQSSSLETTSVVELSEQKVVYAGSALRLLADTIDSLFLDLVTFLIGFWCLEQTGFFHSGNEISLTLLASLLLGQGVGGQSVAGELNPMMVQWGLGGIRLLLSLVYYTWMGYRFQTSLGKQCLRMKLVSFPDQGKISLKQSFLRCLGYAASYGTLGFGFTMIFFHPYRRGLHDLIAHTAVCIRPKVKMHQQDSLQ